MEKRESKNFIEQIIEKDLADGKFPNGIITRFPPEPNGYLHIGHAKSIVLNFGLTQKYKGKTNLRFDDTNPDTESIEFVESIKRDIRWLGYDWEDREYFTSDYFGKLYEFAKDLIKRDLAYVDDSTPDEILAGKGTVEVPGTNSPFRERSVEENLRLFEGMKNGEFAEGSKVLRAKIDMSQPNMHMRDPVIYRIKRMAHHRTGNEWNIYPMYDFAHGQSDSIEEITHSLCTLEFENHRPLYNWLIEQLGIYPSRQIEFARLNLNYTVMSKRKLAQLVENGVVESWSDPRMPTISGMRNRGYTAAAIRNFCDRVGIAKRDNVIDMSLLEFCVREDLNKVSLRRMAVLDPVKLIIENYPEDQHENLLAENNPEDETAGERKITFGRELYIEREDFMEDPPKKFFRMAPGRFVRLKHAYILECSGFKKDDNGELIEVHARYFPESKSGSDTSGIKAKGTLHWVNAADAMEAKVNMYDRLFKVAEPLADKKVDFLDLVNEDSLNVVEGVKVEPALAEAGSKDHFQFMRKGYFVRDKNAASDELVFNMTVGLRDSWAKKGGK
ncbi:MAG: glutamine--tRNA ligase/YqeY domain fusion protein [Saprospirales bacterium]|nr:MAG: glutamine--tRNA ligase/YqeY domain fusion protein [Saprospirales bacterium]